MATISTHVLDTARGVPAEGIGVRFEQLSGDDSWLLLGSGTTDDDGRISNLIPTGASLAEGTYRMSFATGPYLEQTAGGGFYPHARIEFSVAQTSAHYHVPLLLSPWGYSTYRGS